MDSINHPKTTTVNFILSPNLFTVRPTDDQQLTFQIKMSQNTIINLDVGSLSLVVLIVFPCVLVSGSLIFFLMNRSRVPISSSIIRCRGCHGPVAVSRAYQPPYHPCDIDIVNRNIETDQIGIQRPDGRDLETVSEKAYKSVRAHRLEDSDRPPAPKVIQQSVKKVQLNPKHGFKIFKR